MIDDTAYLTYARHITANPFDPYGFTIHWYTYPQSAFEVLVPPIIPYWLALGIRLFGEHPAILKLWLFPFVLLFAGAMRELIRRFARGTEYLLPVLVLSPAVMPSVNLMLDIPALALGLAAVALFARASDRGSWRIAIGAGLLAAVAMQTKYTMLLVPPAVAWYGLTHRRGVLAAFTVFLAVVAFTGWELLLLAKYGQSHFVFHATSQETPPEAGEGWLAAFVRSKSALIPPLAGHLGCLGMGVGLVAACALGISRRSTIAAVFVGVVGFLLIATVPYRWTVFVPRGPPGSYDTTAVMVFWQSFGWLVLLSLASCAAVLVLTLEKGLRLRWNRDSLFLVGWLLIEIAGYFVLTPFPAARRVIGIVVIGGLLAARAVSRLGRVHPDRRPGGWVVAFCILSGFAIAGIDTLDAVPEKVCAERAGAITADRPQGSTVWFAGHWGFQYYCERVGMKHLVPGQSVLMPGDYLVIPVQVNPGGLHRPHIGNVTIHPPASVMEEIKQIVWDDPLSAQTVPNFYGGIDPVVGRDYPRLQVAVYRITRTWLANSDNQRR